MKKESYRIDPIPRQRRFSLDAGRMGRKKHIVHGLAELDVTVARAWIQAYKEKTGERLSFTAFFINCLGEAISRHDHLHAYRNWRGQLVIFEDVNIVTMIEIESDGRKVPMPYVLQAVNKKTYLEIHQEIRAAQTAPAETKGAKFMGWFLYLPWPLRRLFYWVVLRMPQYFRANASSVLVTAVGMFSRGAAWAITMPTHTLAVALGGIAQKPGVVDGKIVPREYLHVTISIDHDVVDGAPIARFGNELMTLIEQGFGLPNGD
jgi:pyruvate/2-oxoglutarate dehydrogenase complex dihydrolipoamide acyltransferase (E2) component